MMLRAYLVLLISSFSIMGQQKFDPPAAKTPDAATMKQIVEGTAKLKEAVEKLREKKVKHLEDVEIYLKAAEWIVRHEEWFMTDSGKQTLAVIEEGLNRATQSDRAPWRQAAGKSVARGYKSWIDGSVQPYGVVYPVNYGKDPAKKWRLDVHLHGRDSTLTEVKFLMQHAGKPTPKDQEYVQIDIYGRGNNAYRWAGEDDVDDAIADFLRVEQSLGRIIDKRRIVLKGFSMGGAGTWHIGLRRPDFFAALQPGAGFTTTHGYIGKLPKELPDYIEKCLTIYDAERYALNAFNVPIVAYSGEKDPQKNAADRIEAALKKLDLSDRMTHLIAPGLEHKFPPEWQKQAEAKLQAFVGEGKGREEHPTRIRFVTYTSLRGYCAWASIFALEKLYEPAIIDGTWDDSGCKLTTKNVRELMLERKQGKDFPATVTLDGQAVKSNWDKQSIFRDEVIFRRGNDGVWAARLQGDPRPLFEKRRIWTGPIDDAFTRRFLCVIGTGKPWHGATGDLAKAQFERFRREWDKYFRGTLEVKKDTEVTDAEIYGCNLILFGDPASNSFIRKVLPKLPIQWTEKDLNFAGKSYDASTHLPMLIYPVYPSLLKPDGYIVLNSGHTFHEAEFKGTNAGLYPRLGDFAVVKTIPGSKDPAAFELIQAGLFDEQWQFPKK